MTHILRRIYKRITPHTFRSFIWRRVHDVRFLGSLPLNFPKQLVRNYLYKSLNSREALEIKELPLLFPFGNIENIKDELKKSHIQFQEGEFAVYISNQHDIENLSPGLIDRYPYNVGLKLIKSQTISSDGTPFYCGTDASKTATSTMMRIVGSVNDKKVISNILSEHHVAPRVYDVVKFRSSNYDIFAMIVEHIDGGVVTGNQGKDFIKKLNSISQEEGIKLLGGSGSGDFTPPNFGNNIIANPSGLYYVDIQNFMSTNVGGESKKLSKMIYKDTHFGASNLLRSEKYSYQSVPELNIKGKRDSNYRVHLIDQLLNKNKIDLKGGCVLDVGCNLGLFLTYSLYRGANWVVGLDMPDVAIAARRYMYKKGFSTFDILGVDLKSDLVLDCLTCKDFKFIFYMSIEGHIGFPKWLDYINFEYILYEGHEGENIEGITKKIISSSLDIEILDELKSQDGDSRSRPMLLCKKA